MSLNHLARLFQQKQKSSLPKDSSGIKTDRERRKVFLRYVNRAWLAFGLVTLVTMPIFPAQRSVFIYLMAVIFPSYFVIRFLNGSERTWLAAVVFTLSVNYGFFGLFMLEVGEMGANKAFETEATIWMLMGLAVLFAGAFIHKWAAPALALLNSILLIGIRLSLAPHSEPRPAPIVFWWMLALTIWLYEDTLGRAYRKALAELAERRQAEESMRESEFKYRLLFENMQEGFSLHEMILDENGKAVDFRFLTANEAYENHTGFKRQDVIGRTMREILPQVDPRQIETYGKVALTGLPEVIEYYSTAFKRYFRVRAFSAEHGRFATIFEDITERKRAEEELRLSAEQYHTLAEAAHDMITLLDSDGRIQYTNSIAASQFGRQPQELIGRNIVEIFPSEVALRLRGNVGQVFQSGQSLYVEAPMVLGGTPRWLGTWLTPVKGADQKTTAVLVVSRDITERKQIEEDLRKAEVKYRTLVEQINPIVYTSSPNQHIGVTYISPQIKTLGFTEEEWVADPELWLRQVYPEDREKVLQEIEALSRDGKPHKLEYRLRTHDGEVRWFLDEVMDIEDENGDVLFRQGFMLDITDRKKAEEALQESEERYRNLFATIEEGVAINEIVFDENGEAVDYIILDVNPAFERHSPYKSEEALGKRATNLYRMTPEFINTWWKEHTQKTQAAQTEYYHEPSGRWFFITTTIPEQGRFATIFSDITERKHTEEAIRERLNEQTILHQVSQSFLSVHLDPETIYTTLHQAVVQIMPCEAFNIVLDDKNGGDYHAVYLFDVDRRFPSRRIPRGQGLSGKVIPDGETLFIHDNQQSNMPAVRYGTSSSVRSILAVPLRKENETIGMVTAQSYQPNVYNERHRVLLETLAAQVTTIIENARLFEETAQRAQEFASLFETSKTLSVEYDLSRLLRSIVENAKTLLHAASSGIYLVIPGKDYLELTVDTQPYIPFGSRMQIGEGLAGRVAQTRLPLRVDDYSKWEGRSPLYESTPMRAVLEVPMLYKGELIGVLTADEVGDSMRKFTEADEHLLSLFASQAAGAIHSARLREETTNRLRELGLLYESGLTLGQLANPRIIAQKIIDLLDQKMDWHHTTIRLLRPESGTLELLAFNQPGLKNDAERKTVEEQLRTVVAHSGQGLSGWVVQHGKAVRSSDVKNDPRYVETFRGIHSGLYVPMMIAEKVIGVICIESEKPDAFNESDERLTVTLAAQAAIAMENAQLLTDLQHSNTSVTSAYDATIEGWSRAMDLRDKETEGHTLRVTELTLKMARFMGLKEEEMIQIRRGGLLHDIGKLGVPDNILLKNESLTDAEWEVMRRHPTYAHEMLSSIEYLQPALDIPYCHHEKWDGSGYPRGLKGAEIPLVARIFAVVDVWDAITSDRPYRPSWSKEKSLEYIREQSGRHFDPAVVKAFMKLIEDIY